MPKTTTIVTGAAAIVSAAALAIAGASFAGAGNSGYALPGATPSASSQPSEGFGRGDRQAPVHTEVTDDELTHVTDAIKAKDSSITVTTVRKDADGSYDAFGTTSDGSRVRVEVSKDLATIDVSTGGPRGPGGPGGPGGLGPRDGQGGMGNHTAVTGDELAKVTAAVTAKDSTITVTSVLKDADGSYDAFGTKAGNPVRVEVSKDLKTVEVGTGFGRGRHGLGPRDGSGPSGTPSTPSSPSSPSGSASAAAYRV